MKLVAVAGRTLTESDMVPASGVEFVITATDVAAQHASVGGNALLLAIELSCTCSGSIGGQSYNGAGTATIEPSTPKLECEGKEVLLVGDEATLPCGPSASVKLTITAAGQSTVQADD